MWCAAAAAAAAAAVRSLFLLASYSLRRTASNANIHYSYCRKSAKHKHSIVPIGRKTQVPVTRVLRRKNAQVSSKTAMMVCGLRIITFSLIIAAPRQFTQTRSCSTLHHQQEQQTSKSWFSFEYPGVDAPWYAYASTYSCLATEKSKKGRIE